MASKDSSGQPGNTLSPKDALKRAAALCSRQEYCTGDIHKKLIQWGLEEDEANQVISQLVKESFLDDSRYAGQYTRDKFKFNGWGKIKITHALRQKGITRALIDEALNQLNQEEYVESCRLLLRKKSQSIKDKNQYSRKGKLYRFAAGRGFEPDLIHRILNELESS